MVSRLHRNRPSASACHFMDDRSAKLDFCLPAEGQAKIKSDKVATYQFAKQFYLVMFQKNSTV
jgi:hypothetical protein